MAEPQEEKESIGIVIHTPDKYNRLLNMLTRGKEHEIRVRIIQYAGLRPGEKVLDLGCGPGTLAREAKKVVGVEGSAVGIDPSLEMVSFARQKAAEAHLDIKFEQGMAQQLPFPDHSFDVVFMSFVLHHISSQYRVKGIQEVRRVLKENGRLVVLEFSPPRRRIRKLLWFFVLGHMVFAKVDEILAPVREGGFKEIKYIDTPWDVVTLATCSR